MKNLQVKHFGPITNADVDFGDLTLLVGPQASGKSIFLQLLKLLIDKKHIRKTLQQYNYIWGKDEEKILNLYFGEGMAGIWHADAQIRFNGQHYSRKFLLPTSGRYAGTADAEEQLFYIPAQRILSVADGRPKPFMEFDASTPYVLRQFSETLRLLLQNGMDKKDSIFPISKRLKEPLREYFNSTIFHSGKIKLDSRTGQRKLRMDVDGMDVPFITWSAGQKEFTPLLLGFYWLCPSTKVSRKDAIQHVILEEPEMGLHPDAIKAVILQVIDLLSRGYKVVISTHSPVFLEFAWAINILKRENAPEDALFELFNLAKTPGTRRMFSGFWSNKTIRASFFSRENGTVISKDISSLDAYSTDDDVAEWGGISSFAGKATSVVSKYAADE